MRCLFVSTTVLLLLLRFQSTNCRPYSTLQDAQTKTTVSGGRRVAMFTLQTLNTNNNNNKNGEETSSVKNEESTTTKSQLQTNGATSNPYSGTSVTKVDDEQLGTTEGTSFNATSAKSTELHEGTEESSTSGTKSTIDPRYVARFTLQTLSALKNSEVTFGDEGITGTSVTEEPEQTTMDNGPPTIPVTEGSGQLQDDITPTTPIPYPEESMNSSEVANSSTFSYDDAASSSVPSNATEEREEEAITTTGMPNETATNATFSFKETPSNVTDDEAVPVPSPELQVPLMNVLPATTSSSNHKMLSKEDLGYSSNKNQPTSKAGEETKSADAAQGQPAVPVPEDYISKDSNYFEMYYDAPAIPVSEEQTSYEEIAQFFNTGKNEENSSNEDFELNSTTIDQKSAMTNFSDEKQWTNKIMNEIEMLAPVADDLVTSASTVEGGRFEESSENFTSNETKSEDTISTALSHGDPLLLGTEDLKKVDEVKQNSSHLVEVASASKELLGNSSIPKSGEVTFEEPANTSIELLQTSTTTDKDIDGISTETPDTDTRLNPESTSATSRLSEEPANGKLHEEQTQSTVVDDTSNVQVATTSNSYEETTTSTTQFVTNLETSGTTTEPYSKTSLSTEKLRDEQGRSSAPVDETNDIYATTTSGYAEAKMSTTSTSKSVTRNGNEIADFFSNYTYEELAEQFYLYYW